MSNDEKKIKYVDGRPVPMYRISGREEMIELAKRGAISWEYGAFTESANADPGCSGRTWENEYLNRPDKVQYTTRSFDVYEDYCRSAGVDLDLNENSNVIEFGCAGGRNLVAAVARYGCSVTGIDICQEVIDMAESGIYPEDDKRGVFFKANIRTSNFLEQFEDDQFDLGICDAFLMCIAAGEEKRVLISEIMRICKGVWFHEADCPTQSDYGEANAVQSGEDLSIYDSRLVSVKDLHTALDGDPVFRGILARNASGLVGKTFYVPNRPVRGSGSRFYVYKK